VTGFTIHKKEVLLLVSLSYENWAVQVKLQEESMKEGVLGMEEQTWCHLREVTRMGPIAIAPLTTSHCQLPQEIWQKT
jgi:hypothetical protein